MKSVAFTLWGQKRMAWWSMKKNVSTSSGVFGMCDASVSDATDMCRHAACEIKVSAVWAARGPLKAYGSSLQPLLSGPWPGARSNRCRTFPINEDPAPNQTQSGVITAVRLDKGWKNGDASVAVDQPRLLRRVMVRYGNKQAVSPRPIMPYTRRTFDAVADSAHQLTLEVMAPRGRHTSFSAMR